MLPNQQFRLREAFGLMLKYKTGIILVILLNVLWSFFQICFPFLTRSLVDSGIQYSDMEVVTIILVSQLLLFIGIQLSDILRKWILRHIGVRISLMMTLDYLKTVMRKPLSFFTVEEQGKTIQQFNDNYRVEAFMTTDTSFFLESILKILMFGALLFIFDVQIGLLMLASMVVLGFWVFFHLRYRKELDDERFKMSSSIRSEIIDIFKGIIDLKSNNQEDKRLANWHQIQNLYSNSRLNILRNNMMIDVGIYGVTQLRDIFILFIAAKATIAGTMTLGTLLAIQYILGQLWHPVEKLVLYIPKYLDTKVSLGRINKILSIDDDGRYTQQGLPPADSDIQVKGLGFSYKESIPVIKDLDIHIPFGKKVAIIGESGSGKSTLMKLLVGLLSYQQGNIIVGDLELNKINLNSWLKGCTIVLHLDLCLIRDIIDRNTQGLHAVVNHDINLSKGQIQRVLLARALYKNSGYFLLDEPFSALDGPTYRKILDNLKATLDDRTFIIITHKLGVAQKMDLIYMMDDGKVIESGTHQELMNLGNRYADLFKEEL